MTAIGVVFPGQGSQRPGMARDFHERFAAAREVFAEASDALALDMAALCFQDDPRLDLTEYTQPAVLVAEMAMFRSLTSELGLAASVFGGHSLGEYAALCAAGAIPLDVAAKLVRRRGALMQRAVPAGEGAMVAVSGVGVAALDLRAAVDALEVDIANFNSPDQVVLSGPAVAMDEARARVLDAAGATRLDFVPLAVSAPFHSRRMRSIEEDYRAALVDAAARFVPERATAVASNVLGGLHTGDRDDLVDSLSRQVSSPVSWIANMDTIAARAGRIFEVGPGRPLRGFFKSIGVDVTSIVSRKTAEKALAA